MQSKVRARLLKVIFLLIFIASELMDATIPPDATLNWKQLIENFSIIASIFLQPILAHVFLHLFGIIWPLSPFSGQNSSFNP